MWPLRSAVLLKSAPGSLSASASAVPTLWQQAVRVLPSRAKILPIQLGGERDQGYAAWKGDKLLGAAAVKALMKQENTAHASTNANTSQEQEQEQEQQQQHDKGSATRLMSIALSNSFFAANVETILPGYVEEAKRLSDHQVGSMLEAAVAHVHDAGAGGGDDHSDTESETAVSDLAAWLVREAGARPGPDVKGFLLHLGGTIEEADRIGGADHDAIFQATAKLGERTEVAIGDSKKKAEQLAAAQLLEKLGQMENCENVPDRTVVFTSTVDPMIAGQWKKHTSQHREVHLKNENLQEWWLRGAMIPKSSSHRAMLAPMVFLDCIVAVDSWMRAIPYDTDTLSAAFMIITSKKQSNKDATDTTEKQMTEEYHVTPIFEATSNTQVRNMLGVEANKIIEGIACPPLMTTVDVKYCWIYSASHYRDNSTNVH